MSEITEAKGNIFHKKKTINIRGELRQIEQPWVMGILNVTPDSFFDGGQYNSVDQALKRAGEMLKQGAHILDVGASSTRPGAAMLSAEEEIDRLRDIFPALRMEFPDAIFSIDTYNSEVARAMVLMGADIINDVSGGTYDPQMPEVMGELKVPYILMHTQGSPADMQKDPQYQNVTKEVMHFFSRQINRFLEQGINDIILDPGFGFGKNLEHNYQLLAQMDLLKMMERPVLVGVSRKSMINKITGRGPREGLNGTTAVHMLALQRGADILRVHDVPEALEAVKIHTFTQKFS